MLIMPIFSIVLVSAARAPSIKLLAPGVGWMVPARDTVLWTNDGGINWKSITPSDTEDSVIAAIHFLDISNGSVLLAHGSVDAAGDLHFDLAKTNNGGNSWAVAPLNLPASLRGSFFGGGA
jgi:photosystem II stability/assembly factor-like uncharacterized protein